MSGPTWIEAHLPDLFKRIPYPLLAMPGSVNARRWEARIRKALRRLNG